MRRIAPLVLLLVAGCGSGVQTYMPLDEGNKWTYESRIDSVFGVTDLEVTSRAPVGRNSGWKLEGDMGTSRLAWVGDSLLAAELAGTTYSPPIPIFARDKSLWNGTVSTTKSLSAATARLARSTEKIKVGGREFSTIKCVLDLKVQDDHIQLTTWFFPGMGIIRQEQRSGPGLTRDRFLECISGPS